MEKNASELFEEMKREMEELNNSIYVEDGYVVVNVHYEYNIPVTSLTTHEDILGWVYHLSEKTWMSRKLLRHFIRVAHSANNLGMPRT